MKKPQLLLIAAVTVVLIAAGAVLISGRSGTPSNVSETTPPVGSKVIEVSDSAETSGTPLQPYGDDTTSSTGKALPALSSVDIAGQPASVDGPALVIVAAHWCPHCQRELPKIAKMQQQGTLTTPLYVISTAQSPERGNWPASDWLTGLGLNATILVDDQDSTLAAAVGTTSFPYMIAVNSAGDVTGQATGELTEQQILDLVATAG